MFARKIIKELELWRANKSRKPLIIRGARQVGKTTVINQFSGQFKHYLYFNLELPEDRLPFDQFSNIEILVQTLFFLRNIPLADRSEALVFIDEIQEAPQTLNRLRYFYEAYPEIAVIAAGSLLETLFDEKIHLPVGRVEFKIVRPVSFEEFLNASGESSALEQCEKIPIPKFSHTKLLSLFRIYALIGGMPEIVQTYIETKDFTAIAPIYDSLINAYLEDIEKYANSSAQTAYLRHSIRAAFHEAGKRIKFEGFGHSNYRSREMAESLRTLEKALLLHLIYPTTSTQIPAISDLKKSPRLQILDTGLLNYFAGLQSDIIGSPDLHDVYRGSMIEHLIGQEILSLNSMSLYSLGFWVREKSNSSAEVDFIYPYKGKLIPIEVKSGPSGKLKSLHQFMNQTNHRIAVRFYSGELLISEVKTTNDKTFFLLNLPYYLVFKINEYLEWAIEQIKVKD